MSRPPWPARRWSRPTRKVGHDLSIGGELAGRSMVKGCLAWAFANGVECGLCRNALDYLRGDAIPPFGYYHDSDLVEGRPAGAPLHCLALDADPVSGLIPGYGEHFGFHRFVCLLGEDYRGPSVRGTYALDPRTGAEIAVNVRLLFSKADIDYIYAYKRTSLDDLKRAADAILGPAMRARHDAERARVASKAIDEAFATCGASTGEMLTEPQRQKLFLSIAQKIAPFVLHQMKGLPPNPVRGASSVNSDLPAEDRGGTEANLGRNVESPRGGPYHSQRHP
jgi:hypothetical protein